MPLDEIRMLDYFDCSDPSGVEQGDRIPSTDVEDGSDYAADVCTNFDDAFHNLDFPQTFDGDFDPLAMRINEVEFALVFRDLLSIAMGIDSGEIILGDEAQDGDRVCFVVQGIKVATGDVGGKEGRSKVLGDMMHRLVGCERTEPFGCISRDLSKNSSEDVYHRDTSHQSRLKEDVVHCLGVLGESRVNK